MAKKSKIPSNTIVLNKKARFSYAIEKDFEAGVVLQGWEVKSLRCKQVQISESYVRFKKEQLWIVGALITPLVSASTHVDAESDAVRKLLLHKKEINYIIDCIKKYRMTCIPLSLYWKNGKVKCKIALAKGKKQHDKRQTIKERQWNIDKSRVLKNNR